ncbi:MAG: methylated-DNA--[protein]-cysteine S-methyltransferase [Pikeienuella sp.]
MHSVAIDTEFGRWGVEEENGAIVRVNWRGVDAGPLTPLLMEARAQLTAYAAGKLTSFDLPLAPAGGELQQAVMAEMLAIPFGETRTYGEIAKALGTAAQPIGQACGANPIPVIIPCHRVTGTGGLGGFSGCGGVETKVALLKHEGAFSLLL